MSQMPNIATEIDISSIQKAIALAIPASSRSMELLLADAAFYTAVKAQAAMPAADMATIDASLDEVVYESNKRPRFNEHGTMRVGALQWTRGMMIAVQRTNPNSKFSRVTGNRWPLAKPPFKRGDYQNWEYFRAAAERMKSARHSSTHFLKSGWKGVFTKIKSLGLRRKFSNPSSEDNPLNVLGGKAEAMGVIARGGMGTSSQWISIENAVGDEGKSDALSKEHKQAAMDYGLPALQWAVDKQAEEMRGHNLEKNIGDDLRAAWESVPNAPAYQKGYHNSAARWAETEAVAESGALEAFS